MGGLLGHGFVPTPDERIKKLKKKFYLTDGEVEKMYRKFAPYDYNSTGDITIKDFYDHLMEEKKNLFCDVLFEFAGIKNRPKNRAVMQDPNEKIIFSQYVELCCIVCLFEESDLIKFIFFIYDEEKMGTVNKNELKSYVDILYNGIMPGNLVAGLEAIDNAGNWEDEKVRILSFQQVMLLHHRFPGLFYPMFRFQSQLQRRSASISFWTSKRRKLLRIRNGDGDILKLVKKRTTSAKTAPTNEKVDPELEKEIAKQREEKENELKVMNHMGIVKYYLMPWKRAQGRIEVFRIAEIEAELDKEEKVPELDISEENLNKLAKILVN